MADTSNLTQFLTDVADAIRSKTGNTDAIPAANFDTEIKSIDGGSGSGDVKLFETIDDMNNSTGNTEGDLAIVYTKTISTITESSTFSTVTFPDTVVLPEAVTSDYMVTYEAVDSSESYANLYVALNSSNFMIEGYTDTGDYQIYYTSEDGITYTRADELGSTVDFGIEVYCMESSQWTDYFGYFMQIESMDFEGLYEYDGTGYNLAETQLTATPDYVYGKTFYGTNGVEEGTLGTDISSAFNDANAAICSSIEVYYKNMDAITITDDNYTTILNQPNIVGLPSTVPIDSSNLTTMQQMFGECTNLISVNLSNFDMANVTNLQSLFLNCSSLVTTDLPNIDISNVTTIAGVFENCSSLTSLDLSNWNISSVTAMNSMFYGCSSLTSLDVSNFDTTNVTTMVAMFEGCTALTELNLSSFTGTTNTGSASTGGTTSSKMVTVMFRGCTNLQTLDISGLDWRNTYSGTFNGCTALETVYVKDEDSKTYCDTALSNAGLSITSTIKE